MRKRAANRRKTAIYWPYEPSWDYDPDLEMWSAETDDGFLLMINRYWDGYEQDGYEMQIDYPSGSTGIYWGDNEMKLMEQADYMLNQYRERNVDASSRKQLGAYLKNAEWEYDEYRGWIDIDYGDQVVYSKDDGEFSFHIMTDFPDCVAPDFDEFVERTEWYIRVSDKGYANAWNDLFWWEPIGYHTLDGAIDAAEKFIDDFFAEYVHNKGASFKRSAYKWEDMYDPFDEAFITTINDEYDAIITTCFYDGAPGNFNKYEDETEWSFYIMSNPWNEIIGDVEPLGVLTFDEALYAAEQKIDDFISVNG